MAYKNPEDKKAYNKKYHEDHRAEHNARSRAYDAAHRDEHVARSAAWDKAHPEEFRKRNAKCFQKNKDKRYAYRKNKNKTDIQFRLANTLRSRLSAAIKAESKKGSAVKDLGCSIKELKQYLEEKFQPGMTWDNWSRTGWHIDHIKPLDSFDLTDEAQLKLACHYTNLQPLWAVDNIVKGANV